MDNLIRFPDRKGDISYIKHQQALSNTLDKLEKIRYDRIMSLKRTNIKQYIKEINEFYDKKYGVKKEETVWDDRKPTLFMYQGKLTAVRPKMGNLDIKVIPMPSLR